MLLAVALGIAIGLVVGAVGGGGAILALPVLVYVLDQPVGPAATTALIVVAFAAVVGAAARVRHGHVRWRLALTFAPAAAIGSLLGTLASTAVGGRALLVAFVPVMLLAAGAIWRRADAPEVPAPVPRGRGPLVRTLVAGFGVGLLTGFFGVGGGFLIVPVLGLWLGLDLRAAVATSLVIIAVTALAALVSHLATGAELDVALTLPLAAATGVGAAVGAVVGTRLPQAALARLFAALIVAVALLMLVDVLVLGGPPGG